MRVIFVDFEVVIDGVPLSEEGGWWFEDGRILIYRNGRKKRGVFGDMIHEVIEYVFEAKFKFNHPISHFLANIGEFLVTFGKADQRWVLKET